MLVDIVNGNVTESATINLDAELPFDRAKKLKDLEVEVLICGAVSQTYVMALWAENIEVISCAFGPADEILSSYLKGDLMDGSGCGRQKRRRHRRGGRNHGFP